MKKRLMCLFFAVVFGPQALQAKEYTHPGLKSKEKTIRTVVVLPPKVEVTKAGVKGMEPMVQESETVAVELTRIVSDQLRKKGLVVQGTASTVAKDNLTYALADSQNRYDALAGRLLQKPKDVQKGRYTLGDEVAALGLGSSVDAIVFIRSAGTMLTGGKKAFGWLVAGPKNHGLFSTITLVDARTGDVLFLSVVSGNGNFVESTAKVIEKPITKSFKKLP